MTATATMAGEGAAAGAGSSCAQAGSAWSAQRSAPESGNSQSLPGLRDPEGLKPQQLLAQPGHSPAEAGRPPLAGRGPAAPATAAVDSSAGSALAGGAQGAQTGCTWGARCPALESGISMPGLEDPQEVEQAAASSSTGWIGLCCSSSRSMAGQAGTTSPCGQAGSSSHSGQAGGSTGPGGAGCQPNSSQAGTNSDSVQGSSSTAPAWVDVSQGARAAEDKLCGKHTAACAQHEGLSMAPAAAAALEELLQMFGGQAPTNDLRQHLAKVQAANMSSARASVRTPPGAPAAGCHHPEVLQRAAANRDSAWDCLARAKRSGLGQQMLPPDLMVSIIRLLVKCTQLDPVVVGVQACGSLVSLRDRLKGVGEETASSASPTAGQRVAAEDHKEGAAWGHGIKAEAPSSWQVTWEHMRSGCRSCGDRAVKVTQAALRCPGTVTVQFLFGNRAFRHKGEGSCLHCQLAPLCLGISAVAWALLANLMVQAFSCGGHLPACQPPASCSLPGRMARALLSRQCRPSSPPLLRWLWRGPAWLCGLLGWLWRKLVWRPPFWVMAVHAAGLGHHWDFLGWLLSVWTSQGGWRALVMPLWLISAWKHHVLHQQPIKLCGGCILGSIVWIAMYQAGIFSWARQLKVLIPLAVTYLGFCTSFKGLFQSSVGQRSSPAPAGRGPLARVPVGGASGEIQRILDCTCHYAVLGVPPEADKPAIAAAWKAKSLMVHPDRQGAGSTAGSHEAQQRVNQAADVLGSPANRHSYDRDRWACMLPPPPPPQQSTGPAWLHEPHMRRALQGFHIPVGCSQCGQGHALRACVDHGAERPCSTCGSHKVDRGDMWVEMSGLFGWQRKMLTCLSVADLFDSDTELGAGLESLYGPLTNLLLVCDMTEAATFHRYFDHGLPVNTCDAVTNILPPTRANSTSNNNAQAWQPHGPRSKRKKARKARNHR